VVTALTDKENVDKRLVEAEGQTTGAADMQELVDLASQRQATGSRPTEVAPVSWTPDDFVLEESTMSKSRRSYPPESLTAAARDGRSIVQAGTEEWLRRGPN
jgi:hypothetical protein